MAMSGSEVRISVQLCATVDWARMLASKELGVSKGRIRLALGASVLPCGSTLESCGVEAGSVLCMIMLPPIYGLLDKAGVHVPDEVLHRSLQSKAEMHDDMASLGFIVKKKAAHPMVAF